MKTKPADDKTTHYDPNIDIKCTTCKYYMDAPGIQIWCDKLGVRENIPTKSCDKYKRSKDPYTVIVNGNMNIFFMQMVEEMARTNKVVYIALEADKDAYKCILK